MRSITDNSICNGAGVACARACMSSAGCHYYNAYDTTIDSIPYGHNRTTGKVEIDDGDA